MPAARSATTSRANASIRCLKASWSGVSSKIMQPQEQMQPRRTRRARKRSSCFRGCILAIVLGQAFEDRPQTLRRFAELFGEHAHVAQDGHEIGIAVPPGH